MRAVLIWFVIMLGLVAICAILNMGKPADTEPTSTYDWAPVSPAPSMPAGTTCWQLTTNRTKSNPHFYLTCNYPEITTP